LRCDGDEVPDKKKLPEVSREQEHEWRELLQKQLADHWLKLNYPEEIKPKKVILEKSAVQEGKSPKKILDRSFRTCRATNICVHNPPLALIRVKRFQPVRHDLGLPKIRQKTFCKKCHDEEKRWLSTTAKHGRRITAAMSRRSRQITRAILNLATRKMLSAACADIWSPIRNAGPTIGSKNPNESLKLLLITRRTDWEVFAEEWAVAASPGPRSMSLVSAEPGDFVLTLLFFLFSQFFLTFSWFYRDEETTEKIFIAAQDISMSLDDFKELIDLPHAYANRLKKRVKKDRERKR
jgi:hypothetical protein